MRLVLIGLCLFGVVLLAVPPPAAANGSRPQILNVGYIPIKLDPFLNHPSIYVRDLPRDLVLATENAFTDMLYKLPMARTRRVQTVEPARENRKVIADFYRNYDISGPDYIKDYAEKKAKEPINVLVLFKLQHEGEAISEEKVNILLTAVFMTNEEGENGRTTWRRSVRLRICPLDSVEMDSLVGSKVADLIEKYRKDPQPTF